MMIQRKEYTKEINVDLATLLHCIQKMRRVVRAVTLGDQGAAIIIVPAVIVPVIVSGSSRTLIPKRELQAEEEHEERECETHIWLYDSTKGPVRRLYIRTIGGPCPPRTWIPWFFRSY